MWRKMPEQSQRSVSHSHASKIKWKRNTNSLIRSESWLCGDGSVSSVKVMGSKMAHVIVINSIATATVVHISFWFFFFAISEEILVQGAPIIMPGSLGVVTANT